MKLDCLIARVLLEPELIKDFSLKQWDLLIRQGRRANLLAKLAFNIEMNGLAAFVPKVAENHLSSAKKMVEQQDRIIRWELVCLEGELHRLNIPIVLLKGAAYFAKGLPNSIGRSFSDVDILVCKQQISKVESELLIHGWEAGHHDAYDQRYYRQWMHEIPPLRHRIRGATIDVHHGLIPETAEIKVNSALIYNKAIPINGHEMFRVLQPVDMFLHSAAHLFHEGELGNGLRDLFDLHELLSFFGRDVAFWKQLVFRASEVGLERPLWYALRFTTGLLGTNVPSEVVSQAKVGMPSWAARVVMEYCYSRALQPLHHTCDREGTSIARLFLYIRSHWIRMPFHLLALHLGRKYFQSLSSTSQVKTIKN